ncbi:xylulokinase [Virgibacillus halophilus]|uniref:xylulokinase n=1 Tax=Tigheibacillus halophilus TaxID=361280 RepID=UPI00362B97C6
MKYMIGIDLGTSAVKLLLVNQKGEVIKEISKSYPLIQEKPGHSEQEPEAWVDQTIAGVADLVRQFDGNPADIQGIGFSGQMHGLVLLDEHHQLLKNAILWNDTRTTEECHEIYSRVGRERLLAITKNEALEGFTLPKILWVKNNEPHIFERVKTFLLPKDYLRYRLTGNLHTDYSDAAGTLLLDVHKKSWSKEICDLLDLDIAICPPLVESHERVGAITAEIAKATGLSTDTIVFAGGADNACGAIGAGILEEGMTMASIGTSGVLLTYEGNGDKDFQGKVHFFNHGVQDAFYSMGVTLAAGHSLTWFKDKFAQDENFNDLLAETADVPIGAQGLLFTPYIVGERTPHVDAAIRGSFIGMDRSHERKHFARAVIEGITFSLNESLEIFRDHGKRIDTIISIGGGAKNETWLQMQADVFDAKVVKLQSEQGPGMGAAMLAAYGAGWFSSLKQCADTFESLQVQKIYFPMKEHVDSYKKLFRLYKQIYTATRSLNQELAAFRK